MVQRYERKAQSNRWRERLTAVAFLSLGLFLCACGGLEPTHAEPTSCELEPASRAPTGILDVVDLVNDAGVEATIPCVVRSLTRPLEIVAVNNTFNAQPADGPRDPRIFIARGELSMSIVAAGRGRPLLELGSLRSGVGTVKAELAFPTMTPIADADPFDRVALFGVDGTSCRSCHSGEVRDEVLVDLPAYVSEYLHPSPSRRVAVEILRTEWDSCDSSVTPDRCSMLDALFAHGDVVEGELSEP